MTAGADAARAWAYGWKRAWTEHDADLVATLYTEDATFSDAPFREPRLGGAGARAYATWAFADEHADVRFAEPFVCADGRAVVEWWALVTARDGEETLAGVSLLEFAAARHVRVQRDYWQSEQGQLAPHTMWGI